MVFNATLNNISVISWQSVLLVEETREKKKDKRQTTADKILPKKLKVERHKHHQKRGKTLVLLSIWSSIM
jgi:hypothetical protein